jgi:prepilin-type N-terminal cleavage/methylation domain-containing protein
MSCARAARSQAGFTIIEVIIAMVILLVGLAGTLTLLDQSQRTTSSTKAREGAVALSRELVEAARGMPYDQLSQGSVVSDIGAMPGFTTSTIGVGGWTIQRRGITFTVALGVCTVDDPTDGLGKEDGSFCADGTGASSSSQCAQALGTSGSISGSGAASGAQVGDCGIDLDKDGQVDSLTLAETGSCGSGTCAGGGSQDKNPEDYKRVVTLVRWTSGEGSRFVLQSTTLPYPGLSGAPRVTNLHITQGGLTIVDPTQTTAPFQATTSRKAATVAWLLDGTPQGNAAGDSAGTTWTFTWALGTTGCSASPSASPHADEVVDGTYVVGAKAFDSFGQPGAVTATTVTLNRCRAYAPTGFQAVHVGDQVEIAWFPSPERDIEGYKVFRRQGSGTETQVCDLSGALACIDSGAPTAGSWEYLVYAYDKDSGGSLRQGQPSQVVTLDMTNHAPYTPQNLTASPGPTLTWSAPSPGDPDAGDSIAGYRIYRDGTALIDRYAYVSAGTTTFTDSAGALDGPHTYYVAAVDSKGAESNKTSAVTK